MAVWYFSRRWLFYKCIFTILINRMYIIRAYILNQNSTGIFREGVEFWFVLVCRRYLKMVCFLGSADGKVFLYDFLFDDIMLFW